MFFVNLIYGHFDILRFQNGRIKKVALFQVCAIVVLQLHTARKEDPITPQTHLGASISLNTTQIPPIYPPDISREVKMSTDNNLMFITVVVFSVSSFSDHVHS